MDDQTTRTAKGSFDVLLELAPSGPGNDEELARIAELGLEALLSEASGLALGPVASVDLDKRSVEILMSVEAASASEAHQKIGLILRALERGSPLEILNANTSRSLGREADLVCV